MRETLETKFGALLGVLADHHVDFIVVGAVGAVLQGAPINTFDLDLAHSRAPNNVERLLAALQALDATYRHAPERRLRPNKTHLSSPGHQLLTTRYGPLDLLGSVGKGHSYEELLPHAIEMEIASDLRVHVLALAKLIEVKEETAGEKDRATLPILRRTLEEQRRRSGSKS